MGKLAVMTSPPALLFPCQPPQWKSLTFLDGLMAERAKMGHCSFLSATLQLVTRSLMQFYRKRRHNCALMELLTCPLRHQGGDSFFPGGDRLPHSTDSSLVTETSCVRQHRSQQTEGVLLCVRPSSKKKKHILDLCIPNR